MNSLTVILPTYNESGNIATIIERIFQHVPEAQVLVVDDNSPDGTASIVEKIMQSEPRLRLLKRAGKEGLGKAYLHAFSEVLKDQSVQRILMMDADLSHDPSYIQAMIRANTDADVVIGSRYCAGGGTQGWKPWRKLLSGFANRYCRTITGMPIYDATAGFILIKVDALRSADISSFDASGYAFLMELKYRLWRRGAHFAEVPIIFVERREGQSKISKHIILEGVLAPWKMRLRR